jgi:hypothetical protein
MTRTESDRHPQSRPGTKQRTYRLLMAGAIGWGLVLLILALVYPAESVDTGQAGVQPMRSLVSSDGYGVLWAVAIPLLIAVIVGLILLAWPTARWATTAAWILSVALLLASLVGFVTIIIGIFVLPTAVLLVAATAQAPTRQPGPTNL